MKRTLSCLIVFLIVIWGMTSCSPNQAQDVTDTRKGFFSILNHADTLTLKIETDIQQIYDNKPGTKKHYQPAQITFLDALGNPQTEHIEVRPRGVTRRNICDFPPLMLKMKKKRLKELNLRRTDNLKLTTYCKDDPAFRQYVLKEYINYRLFNLLTENSFKVILAKVLYVDSKEQHPEITKYGFIIEPADMVAQRIACKLLKEDTQIKTIHKDQYKSLVVFQYMVGNTDWNLSRKHNIRLMQCDPGEGPLPVPYDFDFSGLVNADYASPHPMLPIQSTRERLFQWRGSAEEDFTGIYDVFHAKRSDFYSFIGNFHLLDETAREDLTYFLDEFYTNISSEEVMRQEIQKVRKKAS